MKVLSPPAGAITKRGVVLSPQPAITSAIINPMNENRKQVPIRIDAALLDQIDQRIAVVNERKARAGESPISRNDWFVNMAHWTINHLPHQAVKSDLIPAWPHLPEEALGVET